jgi:hypothetical protein
VTLYSVVCWNTFFRPGTGINFAVSVVCNRNPSLVTKLWFSFSCTVPSGCGSSEVTVAETEPSRLPITVPTTVVWLAPAGLVTVPEIVPEIVAQPLAAAALAPGLLVCASAALGAATMNPIASRYDAEIFIGAFPFGRETPRTHLTRLELAGGSNLASGSRGLLDAFTLRL